MKQSPEPMSSTRRSGFSITEMMVTIGVMVLLAAGVSAIFSSIGDTVARGRKVSQLNRFASQVERVMREDFDSMTRDGFMVIVNQYAPGPNGNVDFVPLSSSDKLGRLRRTDEVMFFARGDYSTARRAVASGMNAQSSEAAIYYGHGAKRAPAFSSGNIDNPVSDVYLFFNPQTYDNNLVATFDARHGVVTAGQVNPNRYARDWSLLRHVTLLMLPESSGRMLPQDVYGLDRRDSDDREYLVDSERQIALQPVARSIFSSLRGMEPRRVTQDQNPPRSLTDPYSLNISEIAGYRRRASGLVDIAVGDLGSIKTIVTSVRSQPRDFGINPTKFFGSGTQQYDNFARQFFNPANVGTDPTATSTDRNMIRKWMVDAMPSEWDQSGPTPQQISRVRFEDVPTRLMYNDAQFQNSDTGRLRQAIAESNQEMLGASVFLPKCTEFIVEWSFGFVNETITAVGDPDFKQMIWYGRDRRIDSNSDGVVNGADRIAVGTYNKNIGRSGGNQGPDEELIIGRPAGVIADNIPEIACFGYFDPKGTLTTDDDEAWKWPRYVRVTMSIADPADPLIEETYQVVFEVPAGAGAN
jgi:type II secretory pathway pseudopilin PulG